MTDAAEALGAAVRRFGPELAHDASRTRGILADYGVERLWTAALTAIDAGVAAQAAVERAGEPQEARFDRLARDVHSQTATDERLARWAVQAWATALRPDLGRDRADTAVTAAPEDSARLADPGGLAGGDVASRTPSPDTVRSAETGPRTHRLGSTGAIEFDHGVVDEGEAATAGGGHRVTPRAGIRRLGVAAIGLFVLGGLILLAHGGSPPANPYQPTARAPFQSFAEARLTVRPGTGLRARLDRACSLLAGTADQQQRGMMAHRDFGGYPAMVFLFPHESTATFYNRNVPIALSVAWFAADGTFITSKDLEPCADVQGCPTVASTAPFRYAIAVTKGGLADIGVGPGASISVTPGCGG